jgi:hypothetical protein
LLVGPNAPSGKNTMVFSSVTEHAPPPDARG